MAKYFVAVIGILTLAGEKKFGEQVTEDIVDDIEALAKSKHILPENEFLELKGEKPKKDKPKAPKANDALKAAADALKKAQDAYKAKFEKEAPEGATTEELTSAIEKGEAISDEDLA